MPVGSMRHRIQLQKQTRTTDGGGGASLAWSKVADVYADIQPQQARESVFGRDNQMREVITHKILIRYRSDITARNRISQTFKRDGVSTTRTFNIKGVVNIDNRNKFLELTCEEGVPT
mgnify:CR=1 FL=1